MLEKGALTDLALVVNDDDALDDLAADLNRVEFVQSCLAFSV